MSAPDPADAFDEAAEQVQRLAVLLEAGVAPVSAWRHVGEEAASGPSFEVATAAPRPDDLVERITGAARARAGPLGEAWGAVALAWRVAAVAGAPLAPTLAELADVLRDLGESSREVAIALAGPRATARIVLALPAVGLGFGLLLGVDVVGTLFATLPGAICLLLGAALVVAGWRWNSALLRRAREVDPAAGLELDLLAIALAGGSAPERATAVVDEALLEHGRAALGATATRHLDFARRAGVPVAALLRAESRAERRRARAAARIRAARLGTQLLLPLGACLLPAFVLLGVVPLLLGILDDALSGF
ncbi:MAG: type II secretion system F family protein [Actinomycetales bacterium]|nr:type II secretion system F family protein [Actinomycetales bacterium]